MNSENNSELSQRLQGFPSFSEILNYTVEKNPNQPFLVMNQESWTYEQFNKKVNQQLSSAIHELSLKDHHVEIILYHLDRYTTKLLPVKAQSQSIHRYHQR